MGGGVRNIAESPRVERWVWLCEHQVSKQLLSASDGLLDDDPLALPQKGDTFVMREDLQRHFKTECEERLYQCTHCDENGIFKQITTEHYQ